MTKELEQAQKDLRNAESLVAQYQGEERHLAAQLNAAKAKLTALGIDPDQADQALVLLDAERDRIERELEAATRALNDALLYDASR